MVVVGVGGGEVLYFCILELKMRSVFEYLYALISLSKKIKK